MSDNAHTGLTHPGHISGVNAAGGQKRGRAGKRVGRSDAGKAQAPAKRKKDKRRRKAENRRKRCREMEINQTDGVSQPGQAAVTGPIPQTDSRAVQPAGLLVTGTRVLEGILAALQRISETDRRTPSLQSSLEGHNSFVREAVKYRYPWVEEVNILLGMSQGFCSPNDLTYLLPKTGPLAWEPPDNERNLTHLSRDDYAEVAHPDEFDVNNTGEARFRRIFQRLEQFITCWGIFSGCLITGCTEIAKADHINTATTWHLRFITEQSQKYTWRSVMQYHYFVHQKRSARSFDPSQWYIQIDEAESLRYFHSGNLIY
ncbi:hypothetical protein IAU60_002079 [Kwoniella sp. DSM 27419]